MSGSLATLPSQLLSSEVTVFACAKGVDGYLDRVIDLTRRNFPESAMWVSVEQDSEDDRHEYIALDVEVGLLNSEELFQAQRNWSAEIVQMCPSQFVVFFVLGWR